MRRDPLFSAKLIVFLIPALALAGAYASQIWGGLYPCEMCWWQRYAHFAVLGFATLAFALGNLPDRGRSFVWLAVLALLVGGGIAFYHAGVEAKWFTGFTSCSTTSASRSFEDIMAGPYVSCTDIQWRDPVTGLTLAGWNAIISLLGALVAGWLSLKRPRNAALA